MYDLIIIGSGPAGMSAAIYAARKSLKTLIIGKEVGGQVGKTGKVENYLGYGQTTGFELVKAFSDHLTKFTNIEQLENTEVVSLQKKEGDFKVVLATGQAKTAKALIIASGRIPRELNVPGEKEFRQKGVSYCEVCDAPLFKGKVTAVIGGGNSALEAVLSLAPICPKVYVLNIASKLTADKVSIDKAKTFSNIEIINNAQVTEIIGVKFVTGVTYVDLKKSKVNLLKLDGIFIEIGWVPAVNFDKLTKKDGFNQIIIGKQCQTNQAGIFAAGDVTDVGFYQISVAVGEGVKAALSANQYLMHKK